MYHGRKSRLIKIEDETFGVIEIGKIIYDDANSEITFILPKKLYFIKDDLNLNYKNQEIVEAIYNFINDLKGILKCDDVFYRDHGVYEKICRKVVELNADFFFEYRPKPNSKFRVLYSIAYNICTLHIVDNPLDIRGKGILHYRKEANRLRVFCNNRIGRINTTYTDNFSFDIAYYFEDMHRKGINDKWGNYRAFFEICDYHTKVEEETFFYNTSEYEDKSSEQKIETETIVEDSEYDLEQTILDEYFPPSTISIANIYSVEGFLDRLLSINLRKVKFCRFLLLPEYDSEKSLK